MCLRLRLPKQSHDHFLSNRATYETAPRDAVPQARERLWIATPDITDK